VQLTALLPTLYAPAAHAEHVRSLVASPALATYSPAPHIVHTVQLTALLPALYSPTAHAMHTRSVTASPSLVT